MNTPAFWVAVDRLGTTGSPLLHWRGELGADFGAATPFLKRLPAIADWIRDPDDSTKRLAIYPAGDDGYLAESDQNPPHREAFEIDSIEVALHAVDWNLLLRPLAEPIGFIPLPAAEGTGQIRRVGFVQRKGMVTHVHVFLPSGTPFDAPALIADLARIRECILYVPTARWLTAEINTLCQQRSVELRILAAHFAAKPDDRGSLRSMPRSASPKPKSFHAILDVQPDWTWEKLAIRLTDNCTVLATYGRHRGSYRFEQRGREIPKTFATFARLAWQREWANPRSGEPEHERLRKRFNRLREALTELIPIPGDPFQSEEGVWKPAFRLSMDTELQAILTQHRRRNEVNDADPEDKNDPDSE